MELAANSERNQSQSPIWKLDPERNSKFVDHRVELKIAEAVGSEDCVPVIIAPPARNHGWDASIFDGLLPNRVSNLSIKSAKRVDSANRSIIYAPLPSAKND